MEEGKLGVVEARFADLIWKNAPVTSGELVKLCAAELKWKKSTTYTVLKKLCDRGLFVNEGGTVRPLLSKAEFQATQSERFVQDTFSGSLPAFIAAFTSRRSLSKEDAARIRAMIEQYEEAD